MCIRDSIQTTLFKVYQPTSTNEQPRMTEIDSRNWLGWSSACLLYTSDAADERSSVDLGGRRIIKKKKIQHKDGS